MKQKLDVFFFVSALLILLSSTFVLLWVLNNHGQQKLGPVAVTKYAPFLETGKIDELFESLAEDLHGRRIVPDVQLFDLVYRSCQFTYSNDKLVAVFKELRQALASDNQTGKLMLALIMGEAGMLGQINELLPGFIDELPESGIKTEARALANSSSNSMRAKYIAPLIFYFHENQPDDLTYYWNLVSAFRGHYDQVTQVTTSENPLPALSSQLFYYLIKYDLMDLSLDTAASATLMPLLGKDVRLDARILDLFLLGAQDKLYTQALAVLLNQKTALAKAHLQNAGLLGLVSVTKRYAPEQDSVRSAIQSALDMPDTRGSIPLLYEIWLATGSQRALRLALFYSLSMNDFDSALDMIQAPGPTSPWKEMYQSFLEREGMGRAAQLAAASIHPIIKTYAQIECARRLYLAGRFKESLQRVNQALSSFKMTGADLFLDQAHDAYAQMLNDITAFHARLTLLLGDIQTSRDDYTRMDLRDPWHNQLFYSEVTPRQIREAD